MALERIHKSFTGGKRVRRKLVIAKKAIDTRVSVIPFRELWTHNKISAYGCLNAPTCFVSLNVKELTMKRRF